jgi:hypothetical protein
MKGRLLTAVDRRILFRFAIASTAAAITGSLTIKAAAKPTDNTDNADKRKARYQANSAEVQNFYRVNRYPAR